MSSDKIVRPLWFFIGFCLFAILLEDSGWITREVLDCILNLKKYKIDSSDEYQWTFLHQ